MECEINKDKYLVFVDLETGGLNPARHPIIQLAAIAIGTNLEPVEAIELKVQFNESQATKQSLRKNHYSRGVWVKEGLPPEEAARCLARFLSRYPGYTTTSRTGNTYSVSQLVAHNAVFDGTFLHAWYERLGVFLPARFQVLCTLQRAHWFFAEHSEVVPPRNLQLATLCEYFRVPFHAANAHDALGDVTATYLLYRAIIAADRASAAGPQTEDSREQTIG